MYIWTTRDSGKMLLDVPRNVHVIDIKTTLQRNLLHQQIAQKVHSELLKLTQ